MMKLATSFFPRVVSILLVAWCSAAGAACGVTDDTGGGYGGGGGGSGGKTVPGYPNKPVRLLVGFAPGGLTDILARVVAEKLSLRLGHPVIIENKAGTGGTIAADLVAKSPPDGYTLLLAHSSSNSAAPALYAKLPYSVSNDFTPIVRVANIPLVLSVNAALAVKDVKDLIALAKSKPNAVSVASAGNGSSQHLAAECFQTATGVRMAHIPYKGSAPAVSDLVSGQVQVSFEAPSSVMAHANEGKLRLLAITSGRRSPILPAVPTIEEAGVKNATFVQWIGVMAPAKLPADITEKLNAEISAVLKQPEVVEKVSSYGAVVATGSPQEFARLIASDSAAFARLVKQANIKVD